MPKNSALGKALIRKQNKPTKASTSYLHTTEEGVVLKSVIDQNNLDEFMSMAALANRQFQAEKNVTLVSETRIVGSLSKLSSKDLQNYRPLQLPHRPKWTPGTTPEQLEELEKESFLKWRRSLADTEEAEINSAVTPFEKNLEVWRQLWRVIERSSIVCQIVDARNPLFFRSPDLELYLQELGKRYVLILNKADLVEEPDRGKWAEFYRGLGLEHYFFSAYSEQQCIDRDLDKEGEFAQEFQDSRPGYVHSGRELLARLSSDQAITIGCVGYPNVGKSSVINVLCRKKLVGVAAQPGKTKHLQTLIINEKITLCDCPGLVFPSLLSSRAEMVTCGVLPIDQIKDVISPVEIVCLRVKSKVLEERYGITLGGRVPARTLLQKIAVHRSFYTGSGLPDEVKAGKMVLKDYVNGKTPFVHMPPNFELEVEDEMKEEVKEEIDSEFFQEHKTGKLTVDPNGAVKYEGHVKLNKQEKREIKFAARRGEDPGEKLKQILKGKGLKG